jgi:hypothetical protein
MGQQWTLSWKPVCISEHEVPEMEVVEENEIQVQYIFSKSYSV